MEVGELNEAMHTGLRKLCVSDEANHLWNLLNSIGSNTSLVFYITVKDAIDSKPKNMPIPLCVEKCVKEIIPQLNPYTYHELISLQSACGLLSTSDWEGFCGFIEHQGHFSHPLDI